ncbi:hypothetical protein F4820DRAFT_459700 [Hypoxylon rubiginosum]|uniref:Uncharacterized protein n=1 Tax=Hypoxylon rubiginosum TaxID=110542 RepID=A0ACB9YV21_9PEZI|nr:hypothetical protein F4820DRAFT_459700 [Hypoxylon rubiginosum]
MHFLLLWILNLYRWLYQAVKEQDNRQENLEERDDRDPEVQDNEQGNLEGQVERQEKQNQILLNLQRTMDPWIATRVYNNKYNPLGQLPEELLLLIIYYLSDDIVSMYCLRHVSRTFRRLINKPDIISEWFNVSKPIRRHLQKDGLCDECKLWYDVPVEGSSRRLIQSKNLENKHKRWPFTGACGISCKFKRWHYNIQLYCEPCGEHHDVAAFSPANQDPVKRDRRCLGREGAVQLCEHIHITWAIIETHIATWQQYKPVDWQACFDHFQIECRDPTHDTRCTEEEAPTYPKARLRHARCRPDVVVLELIWKPHSGLNAVTVTPDMQIPISELRSLFQKHRQGPAGIQVPSYTPNGLPEMGCFNESCTCIFCETKSNENSSTAVPSNRPSLFHDRCYAYHRLNLGYGYGDNARKIQLRNHRPKDEADSECLITSYKRDILVCPKEDNNKINPTHPWFHAMDPDTYHRPEQSLPLCKNKNCMHYYRGPRSFKCTNLYHCL